MPVSKTTASRVASARISAHETTPGAGGLDVCFSSIDDVITSCAAVLRGALLGVWAVDEDRAITALDDTVVEANP